MFECVGRQVVYILGLFILFSFLYSYTHWGGLGICGVQRVTTGDTGPCGLCWYIQREWATAVTAETVGALHSHHRVDRRRRWWLCVCVCVCARGRVLFIYSHDHRLCGYHTNRATNTPTGAHCLPFAGCSPSIFTHGDHFMICSVRLDSLSDYYFAMTCMFPILVPWNVPVTWSFIGTLSYVTPFFRCISGRI